MASPGVFFTAAYPKALPYLRDVCKSAMEQTRTDFDLVVVNDGCDSSAIEDAFKGLPIILVDGVKGIAANRLLGIEYAKTHGYDYLLFCDADDTFTANRYELTLKEFEDSKADIVVCNLNIVDEQLRPMIPDYFNKELPESQWITPEFLMTKNIFGMSNTAIRLSAITDAISIPDIPIVDWYLFTLLLQRGLRAKYISDSLVDYRQYSDNMIGINRFDIASFRRLAKHKNTHYKHLVEDGYPQYKSLLEESETLFDLTDDEIESLVAKGLLEHPQPLWWQIITRNNN